MAGKGAGVTPAKPCAGVYPPLSGWFSQPETVFLLVIKLAGATGTGSRRGIACFCYCKIFARKINILGH